MDIFLPWHKMVRNFRPGRMVVHRISPVLSFYALYPELEDNLQREWALLDTHDSLTDWYKHFRTRGQILRTLEKLGLERIWCEYGGNGVEARGCRPVGWPADRRLSGCRSPRSCAPAQRGVTPVVKVAVRTLSLAINDR